MTWLVLLGTAGVLLVLSSILYLVDGWYWLGGTGVVLAIGYLAGTGWILRAGGLRGRGRAFHLFEHGFVHTAGKSAEVCPWNALLSVTVSGVRRSAAHRRTDWRFTVARADGHRVSFGRELPGAREFGEIVTGEVTRRTVPRLLAAVEGGERVTVGPFAVDRDGVEKEGERVPWSEVGEVGIDNGMVFVRRADGAPGPSALAGGMPNAVAFAELCCGARDAARRPHSAFGSGGVSGSNSLDV
ncbi:hypothetical protein DPM19_30595 [Actinomadura craniellae]|uniref:Uncharacterized protein n=1 Tax=Actinomadura craniellae TaxID=2231787 RepID=A0A365GX35_9ACTN|nr:hypothetical protein DPM19_30595 [Actinomadura craniellae]